MLRKRLLESKWLVPVLTVVVIVAAIWGVLKMTEKVGENLAPIKPRVLIFGATWCQYCPRPEALQKLANDFPGVEVMHYDIDADKAESRQYHISKVPTFIVCSETKGCKTFHSLTALRAWLTNGEL